MSRKSEKLVLNAFIYPGGHHEAAWRHPESEPLRVTDIKLYQDIARKAEAAKLDAIFLPMRRCWTPISAMPPATGWSR